MNKDSKISLRGREREREGGRERERERERGGGEGGRERGRERGEREGERLLALHSFVFFVMHYVFCLSFLPML